MSKKKKEQTNARMQTLKQEILFEIYGISILTLSLIALASFGAIGRNLTYLSRFLVGTWDFLVPIVGIYLGIYVMVKRKWPQGWSPKLTGVAIVLLSLLGFLHFFTFQHLEDMGFQGNVMDKTWNLLLAERNSPTPIDIGGGMLGAVVYTLSKFLFDDVGTVIVLSALVLCGILLITGFSYVQFFKKVQQTLRHQKLALKAYLADWIRNHTKPSPRRRKKEFEEEEPQLRISGEPVEEPMEEPEVVPTITDFEEENSAPLGQLRLKLEPPVQPPPAAETDEQVEVRFRTKEDVHYRLPSVELLNRFEKTGRVDRQDLNANARKLEKTLESFGVQAKVIHIHRGPAVTRYEIQPQIGVKVSRIVNLAHDLALALAAKDIRIEAPIPGKSAIGIEVPNPEISIVGLRDLIESKYYQEATSKLTIALGIDIAGEPVIDRLNRMPHLLVAGATGSGKSVCINGIIVSLLYKAKPHEVKMMMIDPKMVELNVYNGIPHLLAPVVTDPRKAAIALKKVVGEMEKRYELFAKYGVRDIERYNQVMQGKEEPLPYIVVIVDELADLMMVAPTDVEDAICRLAQMARAAGIHLIIATQRPSVDVITGLIKANIPSRIAFAVSSSADSRTILDMGGAEKLLGRGDMLYLPVGANKPLRVQGAFVSDEEVERVVEFVKTQQEAHYQEEMIPTAAEQKQENEISDELYPQAVQLVVETKTASVSLLQRRLRVGYSRAARLIDMMEANGIVGPYEGSKPREVLVTKEQLEAENKVAQ